MNDMHVVLTRHKLDVDAYYRMADAGILGEQDRVELIDGEIIDMAPIGSGHASVVTRLTETLVLAFAGRANVSSQNPVWLDRLNEPRPDFTVLRKRADFYASGHPGPADVLLLVEVSDSSIRFDRLVKLPIYARAGVPEVWIVDIKQRVVDVHRGPTGDGYTQVSTHLPGSDISPALTPDIRIGVDQILG